MASNKVANNGKQIQTKLILPIGQKWYNNEYPMFWCIKYHEKLISPRKPNTSPIFDGI